MDLFADQHPSGIPLEQFYYPERFCDPEAKMRHMRVLVRVSMICGVVCTLLGMTVLPEALLGTLFGVLGVAMGTSTHWANRQRLLAKPSTERK